MVEKFRGRIEFKSLERIRIELVLLSLSTDLLFDDIRKVAKIIAKTECFKYLKNYYLDVQHLIHFDYHDLLVATLISPMSKWRPLQHASCTLPIRFVFPVWKWGAKMPKKKKAANVFVSNLHKFWKFTVSSISHLGDIKEVWCKDLKMSP